MTRMLGLILLLALPTVTFGCGYGERETTQDHGSAVMAGPASTAIGTEPASTTESSLLESASAAELTIGAPGFSRPPEEILAVPWGNGLGEVSLGESDFGKGGPDLMAISPDGKTLAVYDQYSDSRRVNFYSAGKAVGETSLRAAPESASLAPMGMAVTDNRDVWVSYQRQPNSSVYHLSTSGEILDTILVSGSLHPTDLLWVGSSLYVLAGVGGTDDDGYLRIITDGSPVTFPGVDAARRAIEKDFPLVSGHAALEKGAAGDLLVTTSASDKGSSSTLHLKVSPEMEDAAAFLFGSAFDDLPVIMLFSSSPPDGGAPLGQFVAVDTEGARGMTAAVRFDWKVPGGRAVVGSDAVYVMRLDLATGMQLLRVPFE